MGNITFDWAGVLSGDPLLWLVNGLWVTLAVTAVAAVGATLAAVALTALKLSSSRLLRGAAASVSALFLHTPLLLQLLVWYFVGFPLLPDGLKTWLLADHPWATLAGGVSLFAPEFLASAWGLSLFIGAFLAQELQAGLNAVAPGQREAAVAQGLPSRTILFEILLPQALTNARQPLVGQYLNLFKLTSIACSVGLGEITYQTRLIESYNSHAFEAFAVGTLVYLTIGFALERLLLGRRRSA